MSFVLFLSQAIVPILIFYIVATALMRRKNVYDEFLTGAKSGIRTVVEIMPTLIGLMVAVGVLRAKCLPGCSENACPFVNSRPNCSRFASSSCFHPPGQRDFCWICTRNTGRTPT